MPRDQGNSITALCTTALITLIWAMPLASFAQAPNKSIHVGILVGGSLAQRGELDQALVQGLREQGYVEGKNLIVERRYANNMNAQLPEFARELAAMKLDAIVTTCTPSTRAAQQATSSTPIVMAAVSDPVGHGLIASLAQPGRNITGLSSQAQELLPKMLELFSSVVPKSATIAVLTNSLNPVHALMWQRLEGAAQTLKVKLVRVEANGHAGLPAALDATVREHAGALFVLPDDPMSFNYRARIIEFAAKHRMPDFYWASEFVDAGGMMSYGENLRGSYRNAASYIDKVVKGVNPANLPVQQPTKFELVINLKTARALKLEISRELAVRADRVIE